jgi:hypothetical protein
VVRFRGQEAKLGYLGHVLMENRNGLIVNTRLTQATGTAEREAAVERVAELPGNYRVTVGGDKASDTQAFVQDLRALEATPPVAQNLTNRASALDGRTTRHAGYAVSQRTRKRVAEIFGWQKTVGLLRKGRHRGLQLVGWVFTFTAAAYNLVRMQKVAEGGGRGRKGRLSGGGRLAPGSRSPAARPAWNRAVGNGTPNPMATHCEEHCT